MSKTTLFHSLSFHDPAAAMTFLEAVGFTRAAVYTDDAEPRRVVHAQYDWRNSGGVMFGSARADPGDGTASTGHGQCYCVVETDAVHDRAVAAGATSLRRPEDQDYGGRACTVRDAEGNQWSFGSYPGE